VVDLPGRGEEGRGQDAGGQQQDEAAVPAPAVHHPAYPYLGDHRAEHIAEKAREASKKLFSGDASDLENIPTTEISKSDFDTMTTVDLLVRTGLCDSKSEAKKLIASNGAYADNAGITSDSQKASELEKGGIIMLRKGKKTYHKIKIV